MIGFVGGKLDPFEAMGAIECRPQLAFSTIVIPLHWSAWGVPISFSLISFGRRRSVWGELDESELGVGGRGLILTSIREGMP